MGAFRAWRTRVRCSWWGLILAEHDTEPVELAGGVLKVMLGAWLVLPWQSFASSPTFETLAVVPEWLAGMALLSLGAWHMLALRSGVRCWRRTASLLGFLVWFSMAVTFVIANPPAIGWLAFMMAALGQGWCYVRLGMGE